MAAKTASLIPTIYRGTQKNISVNNNKKNQIDVIVISYNSKKHIRGCIKLLKTQTRGKIIIVDNNSSDGTLEVIKKIKNIEIIINDKNIGFAAGVNMGLKRVRSNFSLLLNPDVFLRKDCIKNLFECIKETGSDIAGGKTFRLNGEEHGSYVRKPNFFTLLFDYTNLRKIIPGDYFHKKHYYEFEKPIFSNKEVDVVSGALMLISEKVYKKIGYFDKNFFMYLEDVDFCIRAKKAGFKIIFCPHSEADHIGGASSQNEDKINHKAWEDSRRYYAQKHFSIVENIIIQPIFKLDNILMSVWRKIR